MRRISIIKTRNGSLVVEGGVKSLEDTAELVQRSWTFNGINPAIAQIRKILEGWRNESESEVSDA
jgi:hypothetical protein